MWICLGPSGLTVTRGNDWSWCSWSLCRLHLCAGSVLRSRTEVAKLCEWKQGIRGNMSRCRWLPTCIHFNSMKFLPNIHSSFGCSLTWIYCRLSAQGSAITSKDEFPHCWRGAFVLNEVHVSATDSLCAALLLVLWLRRCPVALVGVFLLRLLDRAATQPWPLDQPLSPWKDI